MTGVQTCALPISVDEHHVSKNGCSPWVDDRQWLGVGVVAGGRGRAVAQGDTVTTRAGNDGEADVQGGNDGGSGVPASARMPKHVSDDRNGVGS